MGALESSGGIARFGKGIGRVAELTGVSGRVWEVGSVTELNKDF